MTSQVRCELLQHRGGSLIFDRLQVGFWTYRGQQEVKGVAVRQRGKWLFASQESRCWGQLSELKRGVLDHACNRTAEIATCLSCYSGSKLRCYFIAVWNHLERFRYLGFTFENDSEGITFRIVGMALYILFTT
jgi:hypothetical protein